LRLTDANQEQDRDDLRYGEIFREVLDELDEPDWAMLDAGIAELERVLPPGCGTRYKKDVCRYVWRAMLARVTT
jgi:hypothetical protein